MVYEYDLYLLWKVKKPKIHFHSLKKFLKVVLLYTDISNFTFWNVKNFRCKNFLIDFLDELGNFKQKKIYTSKCKFFYILQQRTHSEGMGYVWDSRF